VAAVGFGRVRVGFFCFFTAGLRVDRPVTLEREIGLVERETDLQARENGLLYITTDGPTH
jgi:hypothetical protein